MHPEIRRPGPGACPICGMALEPLAPSANEGENAELVDMTRRFWIGVALSVPLLWPMLGEIWSAIDPMRMFGHTLVAWLELSIATPVVLYAGWPFLVRGWRSVATWNLNMFTLIALGTLAAWGFSVLATLVPDALPESFRVGRRRAAAVLRTGRRHRHARAAGPSARAARTLANVGRHSRAAEARAEDRAPRGRRGRGSRRAARGRAGRRSAARAARREDSGRWGRDGGRQPRRRIDAHGRAGAGAEVRGRRGFGRHDERERQLRDARAARRRRDAAGADRAHGGGGPALARAGAAARGSRSPRGSCPRWC